MPFLVEEASANVELLLGCAVLPKYSQCCNEILTDQTWKRLQAHLHLGTVPLSQRRYIGHRIRRLYAARLGPVTHLANVPPNTILPALWGNGTHRPSSYPLRRVRVEHITPWSRFPFFWQCLNRTKTLKTGGFLQFLNTYTRKHVKNTVFLNVFASSTLKRKPKNKSFFAFAKEAFYSVNTIKKWHR